MRKGRNVVNSTAQALSAVLGRREVFAVLVGLMIGMCLLGIVPGVGAVHGDIDVYFTIVPVEVVRDCNTSINDTVTNMGNATISCGMCGIVNCGQMDWIDYYVEKGEGVTMWVDPELVEIYAESDVEVPMAINISSRDGASCAGTVEIIRCEKPYLYARGGGVQNTTATFGHLGEIFVFGEFDEHRIDSLRAINSSLTSIKWLLIATICMCIVFAVGLTIGILLSRMQYKKRKV